MNKIEKFLTIALALIGGISGPWGAYTAYDASKFKQPFDEHEQTAKSYLSQITSAEKRKDIADATRLRLLYEAYEEKWRATTQISQIVAPIESLAVAQLTAEQGQNLRGLLAKASEGNSQPRLSPITLGAAYFAVKDFDNAAAQFSVATNKSPDPKAWALKAATYSALASRENDPSAKTNYEAVAKESYSEALKASPNTTALSSFTLANPSLKALIDNKDAVHRKE